MGRKQVRHVGRPPLFLIAWLYVSRLINRAPHTGTPRTDAGSYAPCNVQAHPAAPDSGGRQFLPSSNAMHFLRIPSLRARLNVA